MPSASASAKEPIVSVGPPSNRGVHAPPRSSVRQRPPEAKPTRSGFSSARRSGAEKTRAQSMSGQTKQDLRKEASWINRVCEQASSLFLARPRRQSWMTKSPERGSTSEAANAERGAARRRVASMEAVLLSLFCSKRGAPSNPLPLRPGGEGTGDLELPGQLGGEAPGRGDVELAVADLAIGNVVAAVAEVAADDGDSAEGEVPGDAGVGLVERVGPERVAPVQRALRLVAHRHEGAGPARPRVRDADVPEIARDELQPSPVHDTQVPVGCEEGELDEAGIVVGVTGGEPESLGEGGQITRLDLHPLEALAAGIGQRRLAADVGDTDDEVLENHVEERDIEGESPVEPPGLHPDLAGACPFRIEDPR